MKVLSGPTELKTLRDAPGCGKRNTRGNKESKLAECLWDCEVKRVIFIKFFLEKGRFIELTYIQSLQRSPDKAGDI